MGYTKAIGRRRRVLNRAHERAQRRWNAAIDAGVIFDETAKATILIHEAERLVDRIMAPEVHPTPAVVVIEALRWPYVSDPEAVMLAYQSGDLR
jgi:hypothetical protein